MTSRGHRLDPHTETLLPVGFNWQNGGNEGYAFTPDGTGPLDTSQTKAVFFDRRPTVPSDAPPRTLTFKVRGGKEGGGKGYLGSEEQALTLSTGATDQYLAEAVAFALRGRPEGTQAEVSGDGQQVSALRAEDGGSTRDMVAVAFAENSRGELRLEGGAGQRTGALSAGGGKPGQGMPVVFEPSPYRVRRLTPRETERLQGLPDDWTRWAADGAEIADTNRYRLTGNAVAVPVVAWVARRLRPMLDMDRRGM